MEHTPPLAAITALALYLLWLVTAFPARALLLRRRTGDAGFRPLSGRPGSPAWWGGVLFAAAVATGLVATVAALAGLPSLRVPGDGAVAVVGLLLALAGGAATVASQTAMGSSWRVGVDAGEHTGLVTEGVFRYVRNPFFTAAVTTATGLTLMAPNVLALAALGALSTAVEIQVRAVEEPHLLRQHGAAYRTYASRTGRFLPGLGRIPAAGDLRAGR